MRAPGRLQREIRQRRPFQSPAHEAVLGLLRTTDRLRRQLAARIEPRGITMQQFNVLRILRGAGQDGLPTLEVADRMIEQTPGVTRLLDRLEAKTLVRRERCPHDRRQHLCWITEAGLALLAPLDRELATANDEALKGLSAAQRTSLITLLDAIRAAHEP
ncbi:MAG TPA: MarR family transcriptional regulator [Vicinamibacterales bacterium]|jgi:DNA-binding MarR family transcriptional regulator|nr:MarR family transcriptional regulator [Vicinamibacterales bacterium]